MPTRLLHESFCVSDSVAECSPKAQDALPRFLLYADNFGCFKVIPDAILGRLWSRRKDVKVRDVLLWLVEYVEVGMVQLYEVQGQLYAAFLTWDKHQRVRNELKRQNPPPPVYDKETSVRLCRNLRQLAAVRGNPRINSNSSSIAVAVGSSIAIPDTDRGASPRDRAEAPPVAASPPIHQPLVDRFLDLKGTPRPSLTPAQVTLAYKRHSRSALALIAEAGGLDYALAALDIGARYFDAKHLEWTLDTIARHLPNIARWGDAAQRTATGLTPEQVSYAAQLGDWLRRQPPDRGRVAAAAENRGAHADAVP